MEQLCGDRTPGGDDTWMRKRGHSGGRMRRRSGSKIEHLESLDKKESGTGECHPDPRGWEGLPRGRLGEGVAQPDGMEIQMAMDLF